jgi:hypothetical protein
VEASVRQIMGRAYRELGLIDRAEVHLARALELSPDSSGPFTEDDFELRIDRLTLEHDRGNYSQVEAGCDLLLEQLEARGQGAGARRQRAPDARGRAHAPREVDRG